MAIDLASLPSWAIGGLALAVVLTGALAQSSVAGLVERWGRARTMVKVVREQRRMAELALGQDAELRHSVVGGPELLIRRSACLAAPEKRQGE
jgi:hypothetical protein